jgi:phage terminase large subunit GpA-like protein
VQLWPVGVDSAKAELHHRLKLAEPGPRAIHFAAELPADFYQQLTAERLVTRFAKGVARLEWVKEAGRRNESLDASVYGFAAALRSGLTRMTAATWQRLTEGDTPSSPTSTPSPWVSAW